MLSPQILPVKLRSIYAYCSKSSQMLFGNKAGLTLHVSFIHSFIHSFTFSKYQFFCFVLFIYLFMAVLGLRFCARAFSSCGKRGPLFIAVRGPLTVAASLVAEHRLQTRRRSNCGSRAQLLRGTWDLPRPGLEPMSPALAGRLSTTAPPGKPPSTNFMPDNILVDGVTNMQSQKTYLCHQGVHI